MSQMIGRVPGICDRCADELDANLTAMGAAPGLVLHLCAHVASGSLWRVQVADGRVVQVVVSAPTTQAEADAEATHHAAKYGAPFLRNGQRAS